MMTATEVNERIAAFGVEVEREISMILDGLLIQSVMHDLATYGSGLLFISVDPAGNISITGGHPYDAQTVQSTPSQVHDLKSVQLSPDEECRNCPHTWYDHGGRFTEEERAEILKHRAIGCRVIRCDCNGFEKRFGGYL